MSEGEHSIAARLRAEFPSGASKMSKSGSIVNMEFHTLLRQCRDAEGDRYTLETLAAGIQCSRPHLNKVLLNYGKTKWQKFGNGSGGRTRQRLAKYFTEHFPDKAAAILAALGWDKEGKLLEGQKSEVKKADLTQPCCSTWREPRPTNLVTRHT